jgi:hypothetical protein
MIPQLTWITVVLAAVVLVAVTVVIHGIGSTYWIRFLMRNYQTHDGYWKERAVFPALMSTALVLLLLHVLEVLLWALLYLWLVPNNQLANLEQAVYFSVVTFTTLGYGDITLEPNWRLLSGIEALRGFLLVGWTTALFFSLLQRVFYTLGVRSWHATTPPDQR